MNITKQELLIIRGGGSSFISGTILNGLIKGAQIIYQIGQALGTSINRMRRKNYC